MTRKKAPQNNPELFARLVDASFEFILIGGVAATVHGSATLTIDLDVAAPFTRENLQRLLDALTGTRPYFALAANKREVTEDGEALTAYKNLYLGTELGRLDVLSSVDPIGPYEAVARNAISREVFGRSCRVISLDDLIAVKAHVARPKDKQMEQELRAIRAVLEKKSGE